MSENGEAIGVELLGIIVHVQTREGDKVMLRRVPIPEPKHAKKLLSFIKHRIHGGQLILAKEGHELTPQRPEPEQPRIITP